MKQIMKWLILVLALVLVLSVFAACKGDGEEGSDPPKDLTVPEDIQTVMDEAVNLAANYALELDGEYGDQYVTWLGSSLGKEHEIYGDLKATLDQFRLESGAYYVYLLSDVDPDDNYFELTVDSSQEKDAWMTQYAMEGEFEAAQNGMPAASMSAWGNKNDPENPLWTGYAPVHDSNGDVVAILAVDIAAPIVTEYPEWNRDSDSWNGAKYEYTPVDENANGVS